jgi:deoxyribodipyrimidine photo-lyase
MTKNNPCSLVWFRQDLRLADNPALTAAAEQGRPVVALYVLDDTTPGPWKVGAAGRWWLHHSLAALEACLRKYNIPLILKRGSAGEIVPAVAAAIEAEAVFWNRCYEPYAIARDRQIKTAFAEKGIKAQSFNGSLLNEPHTILTGGQTPYKVFTPYLRAVLGAPPVPPALPVPKDLRGKAVEDGDKLDSWKLLPTHPDWADGLRAFWKPGETQAQKRLTGFIDAGLPDYADKRDFAGLDRTSRLSPYLHFGEISPRQIWHAVHGAPGRNAQKFLSEVVWREFSYYLLFHFPHITDRPFNETFAAFGWKHNAKMLAAWQQGRTGYPLVDAGMRQLWQTGWMHNRVRMVAASFLVKHLLISWQDGAAWFWDTLVDADLANNRASWQWVAGSGADAAPYFRVFNPTLQARKFDEDGDYIRRYVPELAKLPAQYIHAPAEAPEEQLKKAGVKLGVTYPYPIVAHNEAREAALTAYGKLKR